VDSLAEFLEEHPKAGAVGGYVNDTYLPKRFPSAATIIKENLGFSRRSPARPRETVPVDQPAAAALMIRRDAFDDIGGFDERFFPAWYEDVDFCQRLKSRGWEIYFSPEAEFQHEGGYSAGKLGAKEFAAAYYHNQLRYAQKHFSVIAQAGIRASMAAGMLIRMAARPHKAGAYANVLRGVMGQWKE
jgi:GT2 family glycosyltransferase